MNLQKLKWREENFCWQRMTWLSRNSSWLRKKQTWPCSDCAKKKWKLNERSDSMPRDRSKISLSKPPNFHILTNSRIFLLSLQAWIICWWLFVFGLQRLSNCFGGSEEKTTDDHRWCRKKSCKAQQIPQSDNGKV